MRKSKWIKRTPIELGDYYFKGSIVKIGRGKSTCVLHTFEQPVLARILANKVYLITEHGIHTDELKRLKGIWYKLSYSKIPEVEDENKS